MFLYLDSGLFDQAYYIIPDPSSEEEIQHQYGCVGCYQFKTKGRIEVIEDPKLIDILEDGLGCDYWTPRVLAVKTGLDIVEVRGEGLARLADGRYIAIENCD